MAKIHLFIEILQDLFVHKDPVLTHLLANTEDFQLAEHSATTVFLENAPRVSYILVPQMWYVVKMIYLFNRCIFKSDIILWHGNDIMILLSHHVIYLFINLRVSQPTKKWKKPLKKRNIDLPLASLCWQCCFIFLTFIRYWRRLEPCRYQQSTWVWLPQTGTEITYVFPYLW